MTNDDARHECGEVIPFPQPAGPVVTGEQRTYTIQEIMDVCARYFEPGDGEELWRIIKADRDRELGRV